jgi:Flp pilus assembly protein TadD/SAM-dependent methyltransferase
MVMNRKQRRLAAKKVAKHTGQKVSRTGKTSTPIENPGAVLQQASMALQQGHLERAAEQAQILLDANPGDVNALQLLGMVNFEQGDSEGALKLLRSAVALAPKSPDAHHNLGIVLFFGDDHEAARTSFLRATDLKPDHADAWLNLGNARRALGQFDEAESAYAKAVKLAPGNPSPSLNLAISMIEMGRHSEALTILDDHLERFPDHAASHNGRGSCLMAMGRMSDCVDAFSKAVELEPGNLKFENNLREAASRSIPAWHIPMLADEARNVAYQKTIDRHVREGMHVLDIGAGSGLLAMMAVRAGAERVTAVEMDPTLADVARQIIADNGMSDKIEVLHNVSLELKVGRDLPAADLIVSEILDTGLLGEGVLPTLRHAAHYLKKEDGLMLPAGASVYAQLFELPKLRPVNPVSQIAGFDLSAFDRFRNPASYRRITLTHETRQALSEPFHVIDFDFQDPPATERWLEKSIPISSDGEVYAVAFWFDLHMDAEISISTGPQGTLSHWNQAVQFFPMSQKVRAGDEIRLKMGHTNSQISLSICDPE